ncbi:MAG: hypothetical protein ACI33P_03430 [Lysinibacillus sp.]
MDISLMEAYIIETLKGYGISVEETEKRIAGQTLGEWQEQFKFDFSLLEKMEPDTLRAAFAGEYRIKFVTINGLKNLLRMRFDIQDIHYKEMDNGLASLSVDETIEMKIRSMLSSNWTVTRSGDDISILVEG